MLGRIRKRRQESADVCRSDEIDDADGMQSYYRCETRTEPDAERAIRCDNRDVSWLCLAFSAYATRELH